MQPTASCNYRKPLIMNAILLISAKCPCFSQMPTTTWNWPVHYLQYVPQIAILYYCKLLHKAEAKNVTESKH